MKHFKNNLDIIINAARSIDEKEFERLLSDCAGTLNKERKIIVSGLGKNVPICEKFVGTLTSVGIPAAFMHTNSAFHGDLGLVKEGDLVILLTKSGETAESVQLVRSLEQRNCTLWLLSFSHTSTLYREIRNRVIIELEHEGDKWNILPNNSTVLNLIILQELAMRLIDILDVSLDELRKNHPGGAIGAQLK
ncbi:MAG: SIS domain-containing protein [Lachnospiraceae bacterium]|nr:SIS domain-containing protein [Lachnospiraceae bacterium]